jgi:NADPH:quinone reductase-like Zn-dependent oxidoreductase
MKAIIWTKYGSPDTLQFRDIDKPTPKDNEILLKIHAVEATAGDCEMRTLKFPLWIKLPLRIYIGLIKPTRVNILGSYLAGEVESVGKDVTRFKAGDQVFGTTGLMLGGYAEYVCVPESKVITDKPENLTYEEVAPLGLGGLEALHFLRLAKIQPGQKVLVNGAGGSIGTYAVQLAKHFGAEVTAVDRLIKHDMLRSIGADHVIDYTREDFSANGQKYDAILDVVLKSSFTKIVSSLTDNGIYLMTNPTLPKMLRARWISRTSSKKVIFQFSQPNAEDLDILKDMLESGKIQTVIDRRYSLEQVPEAQRYIETGNKNGIVIITVSQND